MNTKVLPFDVEEVKLTIKTSQQISVTMETYDALKCFLKEFDSKTKSNNVKFQVTNGTEITLNLTDRPPNTHHFLFLVSNVLLDTELEISINIKDKLLEEEKKILKPNKGNIAFFYLFQNHADLSWNYLQLNQPTSEKNLTTSSSVHKIQKKESTKILKSTQNQKFNIVSPKKVIPLDFVEQVSTLNVKIEKGNDLAAQDLNGFSDPYCVVFFGKQKLKTNVKYKTLNPGNYNILNF
jgi:hypothetical protein